MAIAEKFDVPMYCGEYGVIDNADRESALRWFEDIHTALTELHIPRAAWSYKKMNFGISDEHNSTIITKLISNL